MTKEQNTGFGAVAALVLLVAGRWSGNDLDVPIIAVLLASLLCPRVWTPLSFVWYTTGRWIERLFSSVVLFLVYFLVVTPVGLLRRLFAKDTLSVRRFGKSRESVFSVKEKKYRADDLKYPY
ncbi:MAG: hypothetical protein LBJ23_08255 [Tannerella sp.]|jgi:uncharacterized membrane protein|nr:hypothetical protein [Tannerella sp.]